MVSARLFTILYTVLPINETLSSGLTLDELENELEINGINGVVLPFKQSTVLQVSPRVKNEGFTRYGGEGIIKKRGITDRDRV